MTFTMHFVNASATPPPIMAQHLTEPVPLILMPSTDSNSILYLNSRYILAVKMQLVGASPTRF